jgi:hypothetical protein
MAQSEMAQSIEGEQDSDFVRDPHGSDSPFEFSNG